MNNTEGEENLIFIKDNKVNYSVISRTVADGVSYFNGTRKTVVGSYNKILTGSVYTQIATGAWQNCLLFHLYGTIQYDIASDLTHYQIGNGGPTVDEFLYVPIDPHSNIVNVDTWFISPNCNGNYVSFILSIKPRGKSNNELSSVVSTVNLTVEAICI